MTPTEQAHTLRRRADALRRLQIGFLGPISASPYASDTLKDTVDNLSFDVWCEENKLDDEAERLDPWPVWTIADLDRGKTTEAGR
jgi:hypothetical protein